MLDADQRRLLGEFIRAHRERAQPGDPRARRRTPGLRREELAARAGISVTWCAWLEQGRPVQASPDALARLAHALSLTPAERAYLFELAGRLDPEMPAEPETDAPPSLLAAVNAIEHPAYGLDRLWTACCWNQAAARLFCGWLDADHQRNLLQFVFLEKAARTSFRSGRTGPGDCWRSSGQIMAIHFATCGSKTSSTRCAKTVRSLPGRGMSKGSSIAPAESDHSTIRRMVRSASYSTVSPCRNGPTTSW